VRSGGALSKIVAGTKTQKKSLAGRFCCRDLENQKNFKNLPQSKIEGSLDTMREHCLCENFYKAQIHIFYNPLSENTSPSLNVKNIPRLPTEDPRIKKL
jgi:hypothetical protein